MARKGQTTYTGLTDAARKIWAEEGGRAFWKGAGGTVHIFLSFFFKIIATVEAIEYFGSLSGVRR